MGFQKDMSGLAQKSDLSPMEAMLGLARVLLQRAAEDPGSVSEEGLAACMSSLARVATVTTDEANWDELREFIDISEPDSPKLDETTGHSTRRSEKTL